MTRKISLSRIHAINWYGYNDSIPISGNLLFAGLTGSGKSVLMDLLQLVVVGTDRALFNRSATGTTSDRTLKSYCLGDTKREEEGVVQFIRDKGAITYVALEFTWPDGKRQETWGIRIEFRNASETFGRVTPFFCDGGLNRSDFLDPERRPLTYPAFKQLIHANDGRLFETQEQYLRDMAEPSHLNFNRSVLASLMPVAMSFTNLKSFDEFCRRFILPGDQLNVADVVASYKSFQAYESDLRALNDQLIRLRQIREVYLKRQTAARDKDLARYLAAEISQTYEAETLTDLETRLAELKKELNADERRIAELDEKIAARRIEMDQLKSVINQSQEGQIFLFLKGRQHDLERELKQLRKIGATLEDALRARVKDARQWLAEARGATLPSPLPVELLESAIEKLDSSSIEQSGDALKKVADVVEELKAGISKMLRPVREQLDDIRDEQTKLREEISALEMGRLPFPTGLLNTLNEALPMNGRKPAAQPLCKLCEVADERWRPAIEVAFTRKFAIVVELDHFEKALSLYHGLKSDSPLESLVDPFKAIQMEKKVAPGSLAEKFRVEHPVAKAVIACLFGDVICVDRPEQLKQHDSAILPDGFLKRGIFAQRKKHYDNLPFVGEHGLEQQLAVKRSQEKELVAEERQLLPFVQAADRLYQGAREYFPEHSSLFADLIRVQDLPKKEVEFKTNQEKLQAIDRAGFEEKERLLNSLHQEELLWENERRVLLGSQRKGEIDTLERNLVQVRIDAQKASERFERLKAEINVLPHLARLKSWRAEVLEVLPAKDAAAREFDRLYHENDKETEVAWEKVIEYRKLLAVAHRKFEELNPEDPSNTACDKLLEQIETGDIPSYQEKSVIERKRWENLFRTQILQKTHHALMELGRIILLLNNHLKSPIGNDRYEIVKKPNPEFKQYHRLLELNALHHEDDLFFASVDADLKSSLDAFLKTIVDEPDGIEASRLLDYRHYYDYDLMVIDTRDAAARPVSVDKQSGKFSGGESQSPYFVAILASYLRAYKRHETRRGDASLAIVPIDEAFAKLSGERIADCINALKSLDLQGIFSMSSGNIPYAFELCDQLIVVSKHEERVGKKISLRNVAISMNRDSPEARELIHAHD